MLSQKSFPATLTSYDLLKAFAVIIMIVDHAGYYFFPDDLWWRAVGRIGFPIWFFLVGYASGRTLGGKLWGGAAILIALYFLAGSHVVPLNALVTIIIIRLILDHVMAIGLRSPQIMVTLCVVLTLLIIPSAYATEYGTQALIVAMAGYLVRHGQEKGLSRKYIHNFMIFAFLSFVIPQFFMHGLSVPQFYLMFAGTGLVCLWLSRFAPAEYPGLAARLPRPVSGLMRFMGRRTLEIYVGHIVLFQCLALLQGQERFGLFDFKIMPQF